MMRQLQRWWYGHSSYDERMLEVKIEAHREGFVGVTPLNKFERLALARRQLENRVYKAHFYLQKSFADIAREMGISERKAKAMAERANQRRRA
jgi:hypothetical protein